MSVKLHKIKRKNGSTVYQLDIYFGMKCPGKKRIRKNLEIVYDNEPEKIKNEKILRAEEKVREAELKFLRGDYNFDIEDIGEDFIEYYKKVALINGERNKYWIAAYNQIKELVKENNVSFSEVDESFIYRIRNHLLQNLKNNSAAMYYSTIKSVIKKAVRENKIIEDPTQKIPNIRMKQTQKVFLNPLEVEKLYNTDCNDFDLKHAFLFACYTGVRLSDIKELTWKNIHDGRIKFIQKKTGDRLDNPLAPPALKLLDKIKGKRKKINVSDKIFLLGSEVQICKRIQNWTRTAGLEKHVTFHTSRHTFGVWTHQNNVDIYTIKNLMGHRNISTTEIYSQITDKKKVEAVNSLPDVVK